MKKFLRKIPALFKILLRKMRPNKVYFVTPQQSGTHWVRSMLSSVYNDVYGFGMDLKFNQTSLVSHLQAETIYDSDIRIPRTQATHWPYRWWFFKNQKVFIVVRDMRDAMVSHYEKYKKMNDLDLPFSVFLRQKSRKGFQHGPVFSKRVKFFNSWVRGRKNTKDFLIIRYEDLLADTEKNLKKIINFIDLPAEDLDAVVSKAVDFGSVKNMKQREGSQKKEGEKKTVVNKGISGRYKEYFTEEDKEYFQNYVRENLIDSFGYDYGVW
jgi:hypothetical protein